MIFTNSCAPALPAHLRAFQMASLFIPGDPDDYASPDLMVCDAVFGDSGEWLAEPADVEVVSKGNSTKDTRDMVSWYADSGVPAYLVIDPRDGAWALYTRPDGGEYRGRLRGFYGEDVEVPGLGVKIGTSGFRRYA